MSVELEKQSRMGTTNKNICSDTETAGFEKVIENIDLSPSSIAGS
jgi:hypothetical protein